MSNLVINPFSVEAYSAHAVDIDASSNLQRGADLTGNADGKLGIISFWFNLQAGDGTEVWFGASDGVGIQIRRETTNKLLIRGWSPSVATVLQLQTTTSVVVADGWRHILASWDLANANGHIYLDDTEDANGSTVLTNDDINYTQTDFRIGSSGTGGSSIDSFFAEFYWNNAEYKDLSVVANRRCFIDPDGKPVDLGSDGSTPTGTQPIVCMNAATTGAWDTNNGSDGATFTINGTLGTAASSPSD